MDPFLTFLPALGSLSITVFSFTSSLATSVISQSIRSGSNIVPSEESLEIIISKGKEKKTSREDSDTDARTNNDNNSNNSSSRNTNSSTNINNNDRRDNS